MFHPSIWAFDLVVNPVTLIALLGAWGAFARDRRRWRRVALAAAALLLVLSLEPVSNALLGAVEDAVPSKMRSDTTYDALVLLGGAVDHGPTGTRGAAAFDDDADRVMMAYEFLAARRARDVIVTGGDPYVGGGVVEADVTADLLERWGVPRDRIVRAPGSRNTREDAVAVRDVVASRGYRSLLLLTSARHMRRALDRFEAEGVKVDPHPVDFRTFRAGFTPSYVPRAAHLADSADAIREVVGRLVARLAY